MLGYNQDWDLEVNSTAQEIENCLNTTYKQIVNYFLDKNISRDEKTNAADEIQTKILSTVNTTSNKLGNDLLSLYKELSLKKEAVYSVISGNDSETNLQLLQNLTELIILFSIFDYRTDKCFDEEGFDDSGTPALKAFINNDIDKINIFEQRNIEGIQIGYCFFNDSKFIELLNRIYGSSWEEIQINYDNKRKTRINLKTALLSGYVQDGENIHVLFSNENKIINFIYDFLIPGTTTVQWESDENNKWFTITDRGFSASVLSSTIVKTLKSLIDAGEQVSRKTRVKEVQLGDKNNRASLVFSASDDDTIYRYIELYDYTIDIFKKYIKELKDEKLTSEKIKSDDYVNYLFDKLIGGSFNQLSYNYRSDKINDDLLTKILSYTYSCSLKTNNVSIINSSRCNLTKANNSTLSSSIHIEGVKKSAMDRIKANVSKMNWPIQFYEVLQTNNNDLALKKLSTTMNEEYIAQYTEYITNLNGMSGNIVSKISFFIFNEIVKTGDDATIGDPNAETVNNITLSDFKFYEKTLYDTNATIVKVNGVEYKTYEDVYEALAKPIRDMLLSICNNIEESEKNVNEIERQLEQNKKFDEYIKGRFADGYFTEEDFFYLDDGLRRKKAPVNTFVDVEFRVPQYVPDDNDKNKGTWKAVWLPVTAVREYDKKDFGIDVNTGDKYINEKDELSLHAGTYFNNFELEDKGGTKEITLTLKSVNDINLENIIFYSLAVDRKTNNITNVGDDDNAMSYLDQIIKDSESNFRIRFGYRDRIPNKDSGDKATITTSNEFDDEFINRDKKFTTKESDEKAFVKPVQTYPWTYFKITGIQSNIKDGEDTYTITGVSSGSYILNNLSLCGVQTNFAGKTESTNDAYRGTPKNVVGSLAKWITKASCTEGDDITLAKVVFLGDNDGTIITGYNRDSNEFEHSYKYELRNGKTFSGGNVESVENFFFDSTQTSILNAKNFSMENNSKTYSVKDVLDNLCQWLPDRVYYIGKAGNQTAAVYIPYEDIYKISDFFNKQPYKTEKITYQVIEADAYIYKSPTSAVITDKGNMLNNRALNDSDELYNKEKMFHKVYFIRMYYEGPGISSDNKKKDQSYLRVYNYRSVQNQVIENIDISDNNAELGNLISSVTLLGVGTPIVFTYNRESGKLSTTMYSQINGDEFKQETLTSNTSGARINDLGSYESYFTGKPDENIKPYFALNNSKYMVLEDLGVDELATSASHKQEAASRFFTSQQNKEFTGEITIMGDPFYYFDSTVEAGKYEIYLQMNRVADRTSYKLRESKYTGIYYITGIKHSIDEAGKYTTTLSVVKRIFGTLDESKSDNKS